MRTTPITLFVIGILALGCSGLDSEPLPLQADHLALAGAWQDGDDTLYIDPRGAICVETQSQRTSSYWSGHIAEISAAQIEAQGFLSQRVFKLDRMPWEEGGASLLGVDGRSWRKNSEAGEVYVKQFGSAIVVNAGLSPTDRVSCLGPAPMAGAEPTAASDPFPVSEG